MVTTMSSLKKHLSTTTPTFIPLPDFASHAELLYGDIACPLRTKTAETQATSTPLFGNQYFNSHYTNNSTIEKPDSANNASTPVIYKTLQPYNKLELNVQLHSTANSNSSGLSRMSASKATLLSSSDLLSAAVGRLVSGLSLRKIAGRPSTSATQ